MPTPITLSDPLAVIRREDVQALLRGDIVSSSWSPLST